MLDHRLVYHQEGGRYQALIAREDYQGNLFPALERIINPEGRDVIDLGAGTGRVASLLAPRARSIRAFDLSSHMLLVAAEQLALTDCPDWVVAAADHRRIPLRAQSADLVISGWSFCYLALWGGAAWGENLADGLREMARLVRPGGKMILIETLGTGNSAPIILEKLADYFQALKSAGFQQTWIRTDYQFQDQAQAVDLVEFFFGTEMLEKIIWKDHPVLPECTGIWWLSG